MFETRPRPERAKLIQLLEPGGDLDRARRMADELHHLATSAGLEATAPVILPLTQISPATLIGKGRVEELAAEFALGEHELVIFNHPLSPIQQRNLERAFKLKVVDRSGLILEIFAARARTSEGRMQVELANLLYQQSRLVRSWSHLERQRGGVGLRGGPGERQLELDRRQNRERITRLRKELEQVERHRALQRRNRQEVPLVSVAVVGYTNAGKSTLFNALTRAGVLAQDQLFATLDPTLRGLELPGGVRVIISDTVGFIRELPHQLVAAFKATLEEVHQADLLLHVIDAADPEWEEQELAVIEVLRELDAAAKPLLAVFNKIDLLPPEVLPPLAARRGVVPVAISARTGAGVPELLAELAALVAQHWPGFELLVPVTEGAFLARLFREGRVTERREVEQMIALKVALPPSVAGRLREELKKFGSTPCNPSDEA